MTVLLTVFAGYFGGKEVPEVTRLWVDALRAESEFMVLCFDNNSPGFWPKQWLEDSGMLILSKQHGEYDFGSYKYGIAAAQEKKWDQQASHLLLCNDSVIGPISSLKPVLGRMQSNEDEAWGLTQSDQITPHLQSYFLLLGRKVFGHHDVQAFFRSVSGQQSRYDVIEKYELGFSRLLLALGFPLRAFFIGEDCLDPRNGKRMINPTAYPLSLVCMGSPLIKTKALRDPLANNDSLLSTLKLIANKNPYLWNALWRSIPSRRLWQEAQTVLVVLVPGDSDRLDAWVEWLDNLPHDNCRLMLPVSLMNPAMRAKIINSYKHWIEKGRLLIHAFELNDDHSSIEEILLLSIATVDSEWICLGTKKLLANTARFMVQLRRLAAEPLKDVWFDEPVLARRSYLLKSGNVDQLGSFDLNI